MLIESVQHLHWALEQLLASGHVAKLSGVFVCGDGFNLHPAELVLTHAGHLIVRPYGEASNRIDEIKQGRAALRQLDPAPLPTPDPLPDPSAPLTPAPVA